MRREVLHVDVGPAELRELGLGGSGLRLDPLKVWARLCLGLRRPRLRDGDGLSGLRSVLSLELVLLRWVSRLRLGLQVRLDRGSGEQRLSRSLRRVPGLRLSRSLRCVPGLGLRLRLGGGSGLRLSRSLRWDSVLGLRRSLGCGPGLRLELEVRPRLGLRLLFELGGLVLRRVPGLRLRLEHSGRLGLRVRVPRLGRMNVQDGRWGLRWSVLSLKLGLVRG